MCTHIYLAKTLPYSFLHLLHHFLWWSLPQSFFQTWITEWCVFLIIMCEVLLTLITTKCMRLRTNINRNEYVQFIANIVNINSVRLTGLAYLEIQQIVLFTTINLIVMKFGSCTFFGCYYYKESPTLRIFAHTN